MGALVVGDKGSIAYGSHGARGWHIVSDTQMKEYMGDRKADWEQNVPGLPPNVSQAYVKAQRSGQKHASEYIMAGKWKGYTPPPMPKKK